MKGVAGCRDVLVITGVSGNIGAQYIYVEVTNNTGVDILFYPNDFPSQGHATSGDIKYGIPIKVGTTREIPMTVYNYTASGVVTIVAYAQ